MHTLITSITFDQVKRTFNCANSDISFRSVFSVFLNRYCMKLHLMPWTKERRREKDTVAKLVKLKTTLLMTQFNFSLFLMQTRDELCFTKSLAIANKVI